MKRVIGKVKNKTLVEGDANLLSTNEILITRDAHYTLLRERINGKVETFVVIPLSDFSYENNK